MFEKTRPIVIDARNRIDFDFPLLCCIQFCEDADVQSTVSVCKFRISVIGCKIRCVRRTVSSRSSKLISLRAYSFSKLNNLLILGKRVIFYTRKENSAHACDRMRQNACVELRNRNGMPEIKSTSCRLFFNTFVFNSKK